MLEAMTIVLKRRGLKEKIGHLVTHMLLGLTSRARAMRSLLPISMGKDSQLADVLDANVHLDLAC